jgi:hypothetical protein
MNTTPMQQAFLKQVKVTDETSAQKNTVSASFKRNKLYAENTPPQHRKELGNELKKLVESTSKQYVNQTVDEATHLKNIQNISNELSSRFGSILNHNRLKIGTAQKALNLYLKFLWCLGKLQSQPPHCPMDSIVLKKANVYGAWTKSDSIADYENWVKSVKSQAGAQNMTLSEWELEIWANK